MAVIQDPSQRQLSVRVPVAVLGLLASFAIVYAAEVMASVQTLKSMVARFAFYPARYSAHFITTHGVDPGSLFDRAVPFFSYMFLHESLTHLLINVLWVGAFGWIVARRCGGLVFLSLFIVCGVIGALIELAFNWGAIVPFLGASAGAAGIMGAAIRIFRYPLAPRDDAQPLIPILSVRCLVWSLGWIAFNALAAVTGLGAGPGSSAVAWQVHLGGFAAGLLLIGPFLALRNWMLSETVDSKTA
jgi:membrane associated rhomboid family serine protease